MITIDKFNFAGKKVFVRVDFNVPLDAQFNITDDTRIRAAMPTLKKIVADGGSPIIASHLGRPKGVEEKYSLKHILAHVSKLLGVDVQFANDCVGEDAGVKADLQAELDGLPVELRGEDAGEVFQAPAGLFGLQAADQHPHQRRDLEHDKEQCEGQQA